MARSDRTWDDDPGRTETLDPDATTSGDGTVGPDVPPELPGRYDEGDVQEVLGTGGLGIVLAVRDRIFGREVALKVLHRTTTSGDVSRGLERRFLREARITAQLEHPAIVPVHDLGRRADGTPYYVMKRVKGRTLATALAACKTLHDRLALLPTLVQVLHAAAFAHSRGIVHRDLKPANVMVGEFGETLLIDWGLARGVGEAEPAIGAGTEELVGDRTAAGTVLGTPAYMSPEQAAGRTDGLDARSDVWSLGVMLFEVVAGQRPFDGDAREVLAEVKHGVAPRLLDVCPEAPPDLAAVVERALSADPADRYPSARELAAEIEAWLAGRRVSAYRYGALQRLRRAAWYYRGPLAVAATVALFFLAFGAVQWRRMAAETASARGALATALLGRAEAAARDRDPIGAALFSAGSLALQESPEARGVALRAARAWAPRQEASWTVDGGCAVAAWSADRIGCASPGRVVVTDLDGKPVLELRAEGRPVALALDAAGDTALAAGARVRRWDATGRQVFDAPIDAPSALVFAPDGSLVVAAEGALVRWDARGIETGRLPSPEPVAELTVAPDGTLLVAAGDDVGRVDLGTFAAADPEAGPGGPIGSIDPALDGTVVAAARGGTAIRRADGPWQVVAGPGGAARVRSARGGRLAIDARDDGSVRIVDARGLVPLATLPDAAEGPGALAVSPDGTRLVVGGADGRVRRWSLDGGGALSAGLFGGRVAPREVAFSADGRSVAAWTRDGDLRLFDAASGDPRLPPWRSRGTLVGFTPDGARVFVARARDVEVLDAAGGASSVVDTEPISAAVIRDDQRLLLLGVQGAVSELHLADRERIKWEGAEWSALVGEPLATRAVLRKADRWVSVQLGDVMREVELALPADARLLDLSADGSGLAAAEGSRAHLVDVGSGRALAVLPIGKEIRALALSPDGRRLAAATGDHAIHLVDADAAETRAILRGHGEVVATLAFSPEGSTLLSIDLGGVALAWDVGALELTGAELLSRAEAASGHRLVDGDIVP